MTTDRADSRIVHIRLGDSLRAGRRRRPGRRRRGAVGNRRRAAPAAGRHLVALDDRAVRARDPGGLRGAASLIRHRARLRKLDRMGWLSLIVIAWGGSALATLAFTTAFEYGNPNVVVLLQKTQPLWAIAAAAIVVREVPRAAGAGVRARRRRHLPAVVRHGWRPAERSRADAGKAALLALVAAALWGSATAFGRRALRQIEPSMVTSMRFVLALPFLLFLVLLRGRRRARPRRPQRRRLAAAASARAVPGLLALLLYYRGLRTTPAPVATFAELAFPATALVVNYFVPRRHHRVRAVRGLGGAVGDDRRAAPDAGRDAGSGRARVAPFDQLRQQAEIPVRAAGAHDQVGHAGVT